MDGQKQSTAPTATGSPASQPGQPFVDVRGPKPDPKPAADAKPAPAKASAEPAAPFDEELPADMSDMALAPPEEKSDKSTGPFGESHHDKSSKKAPKAFKPPKPPRQPGVGLAIFATMVIILGLGLLATYAYLRTNNIALF